MPLRPYGGFWRHQLYPWWKCQIKIHFEPIRTIPIHSYICIRANANHSEPIWTTFCILFDEKRSKINPTIRDINPNESEPIRNQVFNPDQYDSFRRWINADWFWLKFWFGSIQAWIDFGFIWIKNLVSDWCLTVFIKRDTKRCSEWFALVWIQISEWIGIVLIGSEWISIRYFHQGYDHFIIY